MGGGDTSPIFLWRMGDIVQHTVIKMDPIRSTSEGGGRFKNNEKGGQLNQNLRRTREIYIKWCKILLNDNFCGFYLDGKLDQL